MQTCIRNDHPERPHYHYGPGGRFWCTDPNSALLTQNDAPRGPLYRKPAPAAPPPPAGDDDRGPV